MMTSACLMTCLWIRNDQRERKQQTRHVFKTTVKIIYKTDSLIFLCLGYSLTSRSKHRYTDRILNVGPARGTLTYFIFQTIHCSSLYRIIPAGLSAGTQNYQPDTLFGSGPSGSEPNRHPLHQLTARHRRWIIALVPVQVKQKLNVRPNVTEDSYKLLRHLKMSSITTPNFQQQIFHRLREYCFFDMWFSLHKVPLKLSPKSTCIQVSQLPDVTLRHPPPGAGSAQAGSAGPAGQDGRGSGGRCLVGTAVLEQNIHTASASCFPSYPHGSLALLIFCSHVDSILRRQRHYIHVIR